MSTYRNQVPGRFEDGDGDWTHGAGFWICGDIAASASVFVGMRVIEVQSTKLRDPSL